MTRKTGAPWGPRDHARRGQTSAKGLLRRSTTPMWRRNMFEDALFATNRRRSPQQRWAAAMSFAIQVGLVTLLVALPLFFTEALPINYVRSFVELPSPPPGPPPAVQ